MSNLQDEMLGSPVTPPGLGPGELAGSNPAISTKREVTKVISTGALEASVSRFDSCLLDRCRCSLVT
jgi:hypothetical protein